MPAAYQDQDGNYIRTNVKGQIVEILNVEQIRKAAETSNSSRTFMKNLNYSSQVKSPPQKLIKYCEEHNIQIPFYIKKGGQAEAKIDPITGETKWYKTCSALGKVFVSDTQQGLGKYFDKRNRTKDGFECYCKDYKSQINKSYREIPENKQKISQAQEKYWNKPENKERRKKYNRNYLVKAQNGIKLYLYRKSPKRFVAKHKFLAAKNGVEFKLDEKWFENEMNSPCFNTCSVTSVKFVNEHNHPLSRSLQLIDINKPYEDGNVRWVCLYLATKFSISKPSQKWLDYLGIPNIMGETREVFFKLGNKKVVADGYNPQTNTIYEFHGDYWHGNPAKYDLNEINKVNKKTFGQLLQETQKRSRLIKSHGYNFVYIWESDWEKIEKKVA